MNGLNSKYIYWLNKDKLQALVAELKQNGTRVSQALMTPCEVMKAKDNTVIYASPEVWSRVCTRQSSWYRSSSKVGKYMLVSTSPLSSEYEQYLDAEIGITDFTPEQLPSRKELKQIVASPAYVNRRPDEWEKPGIKDSVMFKSLFSLTGFWRWGDNMSKHWLNQRANHANFLSMAYTTELDGEKVPYSVTENKGVCSSCVEFFNIIQQDKRKLVRACPGAITFGGAQPDVYYDVQPSR